MAGIIRNTQLRSAGTAPHLRTIVLRGPLGDKFGKVHKFAVNTPAEAVRALCANRPTFRAHLADSSRHGVGYRVFANGEQCDGLKDIDRPVGRNGTIEIVPVIGGAFGGRGIGGILLGGALIAASFYLPTTALFSVSIAGTTIAPTLASVAFNIGVSMALGGIASMLSPTPKSGAASERPENKPSYYFDGPVNTTAQGQAVPYGFGEMIIGGGLISTGFSTDDIATTA